MLRIQRNSKGFTLIELLIVIAIIGILAAIALPAYMDYTRKTKVSEIVNSMGAIKTAVIAWAAENSPAGALTATASAADVSTNLGITVPNRYGEPSVVADNAAGTAVITWTTNTGIAGIPAGDTLTLTCNDANVNNGADVGNFVNWTWGSTGTMMPKYQPKS